MLWVLTLHMIICTIENSVVACKTVKHMEAMFDFRPKIIELYPTQCLASFRPMCFLPVSLCLPVSLWSMQFTSQSVDWLVNCKVNSLVNLHIPANARHVCACLLLMMVVLAWKMRCIKDYIATRASPWFRANLFQPGSSLINFDIGVFMEVGVSLIHWDRTLKNTVN